MASFYDRVRNVFTNELQAQSETGSRSERQAEVPEENLRPALSSSRSAVIEQEYLAMEAGHYASPSADQPPFSARLQWLINPQPETAAELDAKEHLQEHQKQLGRNEVGERLAEKLAVMATGIRSDWAQSLSEGAAPQGVIDDHYTGKIEAYNEMASFVRDLNSQGRFHSSKVPELLDERTVLAEVYGAVDRGIQQSFEPTSNATEHSLPGLDQQVSPDKQELQEIAQSLRTWIAERGISTPAVSEEKQLSNGYEIGMS